MQLRKLQNPATIGNHFLNPARIHFLLQRTFVSQAPPPTHGDLQRTHIQYCRHLPTPGLIKLLAETPTSGPYPDIEYLRFREGFWGIRHDFTQQEVFEYMWRQIVVWSKQVRLTPLLSDMRPSLMALCDVSGRSAYATSGAYREYVAAELYPSINGILGATGKDAKRSWDGTELFYGSVIARTIKLGKTYVIHPDTDLDTRAALKDIHMRSVIPARYLPREKIEAKHIPYIYTNLKRKCFSDGVHTCPKGEHQCSRIIVAQCVLPPPRINNAKAEAAILARTYLYH